MSVTAITARSDRCRLRRNGVSTVATLEHRLRARLHRIMKRKAAELQEVSRDEAEEDSEDQTSHSNSDSSNSSGTSGSEDSSSGSESEGNEEVDVNFEFFDPQEVDFHGLKALLQTYLDGSPYNCSELVDTVIKQVYVEL